MNKGTKSRPSIPHEPNLIKSTQGHVTGGKERDEQDELAAYNTPSTGSLACVAFKIDGAADSLEYPYGGVAVDVVAGPRLPNSGPGATDGKTAPAAFGYTPATASLPLERVLAKSGMALRSDDRWLPLKHSAVTPCPSYPS